MDSSTARIYDMKEAVEMMAEKPDKAKDMVALEENMVSMEEVAQGYANFETWAYALGLKLHTRQLRRNAERRYNKARKKDD